MRLVRQRFGRIAAAIAAVMLGAGAAHAQNSVGAHVRTRAAHTDNATLVTTGPTTSQKIAELAAGIDFVRDAPRLMANVSYEAQGVYYDDAHDANEVFHTLNAQSQLALVLDRLYLDTFAMNDQTVTDPTGKNSFNKLALTGNRTDVAIYGASPHIALNIGSNVAGEVRYSDTRVNYDEDTLLDSRERFATFDLGNSLVRQGPSWNVYYDTEEFDYGTGRPVEFETFETQLGFWAGQTLRLFTRQGLESDYAVVQARSRGLTTESAGLDVHYWYVGGEWQPSDRTTATLSIGERDFGRAYQLEWNVRTSRGGVNLDYSEQPNTFLREQLYSARSAGELIPIDTLDGSRGSLYYLQKRTSVAYVLERPRSNVGFRVYRDQRFDIVAATNDVEIEIEDYRAVEVNLGWNINSVAHLDLTGQLARRQSVLNVVNDEIKYITLTWGRQLGRRSEVNATLSRESAAPKDGSVGVNDYEDDQIIVGFERRFGDEGGAGAAPRRYGGYVNAPASR